MRVHEGEADDVLMSLTGPYDFVYDDGWFIEEPVYLERMVELMRPQAVLAMANWFPLQDAVLGGGEINWAGFDGPDWADHIKAYARRLAAHPSLKLAFSLRPWLGLAVKVG